MVNRGLEEFNEQLLQSITLLERQEMLLRQQNSRSEDSDNNFDLQFRRY